MLNENASLFSEIGSADSGLGFLLASFAIFFLIMMLLSLVLYVIQAIALMGISKNVGFDKGWLAWIPIANGFVMPMLVEDDVHESMRGRFTLIYGISLVATLLLGGFIPFISLVPTVMSYYAFYIITKWYSERHVAHLVISIVTLGFSIPFSLLRFKNRSVIGKERVIESIE